MSEISPEEAAQVDDAMDRMEGTEESASEPTPEPQPTTPEAAPSPTDEFDPSSTTEAPVRTPEASNEISRAQFVQLEALAQAADVPPANLEKMHDLNVNVQVLLGRTMMTVQDVLKLHQGSLIELDRLAGEPVDICANGRTIARGEVVVIDDAFGVKIIEIEGVRQKLGSVGG